MSKTSTMKKHLQTQPQNNQLATIERFIANNFKEIQNTVPQHLTPERLCRIATTVIKNDPKLLNCTPQSLFGAVLQASTLGLEFGLLGHAYLVPYGDEATFIIGYQGLISLCRRTGLLAQITVQSVHTNDQFSYEYGSNQHLKHVPTEGERGEVTKYYCYTRLTNGEESFTVIDKATAEKHRDRFSKAKQYIWKSDFDAMALKTVVRKHFKWQPMSIEVQQAVAEDEKRELRFQNSPPEFRVIDSGNFETQEGNEEPPQGQAQNDLSNFEGEMEEVNESQLKDF